ncbi:MAG: N-acetylmuramoyl-L-alanine amidase [Opitutaceae bacterium]|jgi:N-acetylmuramoyl-L-alanine amidase
MEPAGFRCAVLGLAFALAAGPARAAPITVTHLNDSSYVSAVDAAARLGLRLSWTNRGTVGGRPGLVLFDADHRVVLTADSRETQVDGLRVFLGEPVLVRGGRFYVSLLDYDRHLTPEIRPELCGPAPAHVRVIAIDPGHGGSDNGYENPRLGLKEKVYTLDVALELRKLLEAAGYRVILTRTSDKYVELPMRAEIANTQGADLFVSLHFNASAPGDTRTRGTEVFTFTLASQRSDESWSDRKDDRETAPSPVNRFDAWSQVLAERIHREVLRSLHTEDRGQKTKHLGALRGLNCPAILIESAFLSNDAEGALVATPAFRRQLAEALLAGIRDYTAELDRLQTAPATPSHPERP